MINNGFTKIDLSKYKVEKKRKVHRWQELANQICTELYVPTNERGLIYKICYENPESFIEHCFRETKELAKGSKKSHYFVKLVHKR